MNRQENVNLDLSAELEFAEKYGEAPKEVKEDE